MVAEMERTESKRRQAQGIKIEKLDVYRYFGKAPDSRILKNIKKQ
jgi:hypothetical protein